MSIKKNKKVVPAKKAKGAKKAVKAPAKKSVKQTPLKAKKTNNSTAKKVAKPKVIVKKVAKVKVTEKAPAKKAPVKKAATKEKEEKILNKKLVKEENSLKKNKGTKAPSKKKKKGKGGDDEDDEVVLSIDGEGDDIIIDDEEEEEVVPVPKPKKKNVKEAKKIITFVNPITSLTVAKTASKAGKSVKEPKGKFELEYVLGTSPGILFEFLSTPSGLSEWFADNVNIRDGVFTFIWDGSEQKALLLDFKEEKFIRFQWVDKPEGSYFEFKIEIDELTSDVSLIITDFADEASDLKTSTLLWDSQIHDLMHVIGSY